MKAPFKIILSFLLGSMVFQSCSKTEIIGSNIAPPDYTVETAAAQDYINRLYISLLGREASDSEKVMAFELLDQNAFSITSRRTLVEGIQEKGLYTQRLYEIARDELLNGLDTNLIGQYIAVFTNEYNQTTDSAQKAAYAYEIYRLADLAAVSGLLKNGTIGIREMHRRCVNNFFFDDLNMGTANFVVANFQHFLFRYPTNQEFEQGSRIVNGFQDVLFFETGSSKADFLNIFMNSQPYDEGVVRQLYQSYLSREPSAYESLFLTKEFTESNDYKLVQQELLISDEYARF